MKGTTSLLVFLACCLPASSQMVLNVGESYTYQFTNMPATGFLPVGPGPGAEVWLNSAANLGLEAGDTLRFEMFEGAPTGSPFLTRTLTSASSANDFFVRVSAWSDRSGSIRLTMLSGTGLIGTIFLYVYEFSISPNGTRVYSLTAAPPPRPSLRIVPFAPGVELRWPTSSSSYVLEAATSLAPPVVWQTVTNARATNSGIISVPVDLAEPRRFFRLQLP